MSIKMKIKYIIFCLLNIFLFKHFAYCASSFLSETVLQRRLPLKVFACVRQSTSEAPSLNVLSSSSELRSPQKPHFPSLKSSSRECAPKVSSSSLGITRRSDPLVSFPGRAFLPWHQELVNRSIEFLRGGNQTPTAIQELGIYQQKFLDKYFPGKRCDFITSWRDELTTQGSPAELFMMLIKYSLKNPSYLGNQSLVNTVLKEAADLGNIKAKYELAKNYYKDSKVQIKLGISLKDSARHLLEGIVCSTYHPSALKLYAKILNQIVVETVEGPSPATKGVRIIRLKEDHEIIRYYINQAANFNINAICILAMYYAFSSDDWDQWYAPHFLEAYTEEIEKHNRENCKPINTAQLKDLRSLFYFWGIGSKKDSEIDRRDVLKAKKLRQPFFNFYEDGEVVKRDHWIDLYSGSYAPRSLPDVPS